MNMGSKVVIYTRVSTGKQVDSGLSLEAQKTRCEAYCLAHGLEVEEVITDEGVSAGKPLGVRPGGKALLETLEPPAENISGVVVLKLDRLFRDTVDCLVTVKEFSNSGVAFHLVDFGGNSINTNSAVGKMFLTMLAGFAEFERNLTSERTKVALDRKKEKNERVGYIPFGKKLNEGGTSLVDCPNEQDTIDRLRALRKRGEPVRNIIIYFNNKRFGPLKNRGKLWTKSAIYRLMEREGIK